MDKNVTKTDLLSLENRLEKRFDDLTSVIGDLAQSMHDEIVELKQEVVDLKVHTIGYSIQLMDLLVELTPMKQNLQLEMRNLLDY